MSAEPSQGRGNTGNPQNVTSDFSSNFKYIYDIPQMEKKRLADLLDQDARWVGLALRQMGYSADDVEGIRRCCNRSGRSPAESLLVKWGNLNHTIVELFVVFYRENMTPAMEVIKRYVEPKYHILLKTPVSNTSVKVMNGPPAANGNPVEGYTTTDENSENAQQKVEFAQKVLPPIAPPVVVPIAPIPLAAPAQFPALMRSPSDQIAATVGGLPQFSGEELREATKNWHPDNELGKGGFGVVYRGYFKQTYVAIKKIKGANMESARTELRQSLNELKYLNACRHENVVPLLGYSLDYGEPCLVYQYMPGGSLDMKLFPKSSAVPTLMIDDRIKIAKGTARGLQYLHTFAQKPVIHGDIKPGNILLGANNEPKIGDFGLTREMAVSDSSMKVSRVYGTRPYIPPEFISQRQLSTKVDSYSYGLVLYEIFTGQRVYDDKRVPKHLKAVILAAVQSNADIRNLMDPVLLHTANVRTFPSCVMLLRTGLSCTADEPEKRKEMAEVYKSLVEVFGE
ncbi:serine/threonine-protein kinase pelle [Aedes aegypti]|uniref:non-specific serine/threonine protein kinase n=1 Tax=Aedes aegypti TaxID=7159 RepID=A0A6I8TCV7_AEDAE|nr:serine/threonine-protein kinase pelle [Aedes aegypti]